MTENDRTEEKKVFNFTNTIKQFLRTANEQCVGSGPQFIVIVDQFHHKYANISNLEAFWDLGFIFFSDEEVWLGEYYSYWSGFWIFGRLKTIDQEYKIAASTQL